MSADQGQSSSSVDLFLSLVPVALLVVLTLVAVLGDRGLLRAFELGQHRASLEGDVEALREQNRMLRQRIVRLQEDPEVLERVARSSLGMVREGELVYQFGDF